MTTPISATQLTVAHADYLSLTYRPDLQLIVVRWLRDASLPEVQLGHQAVLELALRHGATRWFVDVRRRLLVNNAHSSWVSNEFLPQAAALLPAAVLRVAYLTSLSRQRTIDTQPELRAIISRIQSPESSSFCYQWRSFLNEATAMAWLSEQ